MAVGAKLGGGRLKIYTIWPRFSSCRWELKQAGMVDVLMEGITVLPTSGAIASSHACLSEPVSIKEASGDLEGVMTFLKELLLCNVGRLL